MVTVAEMEIFVQTELEKVNEKLTRDMNDKQKEVRDLIDQNVDKQRAELEEAVTQMSTSSAAAEARAEEGTIAALKKLDKARERESASVATGKILKKLFRVRIGTLHQQRLHLRPRAPEFFLQSRGAWIPR